MTYVAPEKSKLSKSEPLMPLSTQISFSFIGMLTMIGVIGGVALTSIDGVLGIDAEEVRLRILVATGIGLAIGGIVGWHAERKVANLVKTLRKEVMINQAAIAQTAKERFEALERQKSDRRTAEIADLAQEVASLAGSTAMATSEILQRLEEIQTQEIEEPRTVDHPAWSRPQALSA